MTILSTFAGRFLPETTIASPRALGAYMLRGSLTTTAAAVTLDILVHRVIDSDYALRSATIAFAISALVSPVLFLLHGLANMELHRVRKQLEILSRTDLQTGLLNRRAFVEAFDRDAVRKPGIFLIADIDHFKRINDLYGHPAGDAVIAAVAGITLEILPESSIVARLGGEEYAAALLDLDAEAAMGLAVTLCATVRERGAAIDGIGRLPLTVSIGVARISAATTFAQAYHEADRALYDAKLAGRDRVVAAWDRDLPDLPTARCAA